MTTQDAIDIATAGNSVALQWYILTHPQANLPIVSTPLPGGGQINIGGNQATVILLAVLAVGAVILLSSK